MKQTIKKILGVKLTNKISYFRRLVPIFSYRLLKKIVAKEEHLPKIPVRVFNIPNSHVFFGYYDIPQFSHDENIILASATPITKKKLSHGDSLKVGFFDLRDEAPNFQEFGSTRTWCWQQGCRLQWYPNRNQNLVIYNDLVEGHYGCVIRNIKNGKLLTSFSRPIYSISRDGKWGLSLDFSRLQRLRPGYGYNTIPDKSAGENMPKEDGIWKINMLTGEEKLLFSVHDIAVFNQNKQEVKGQHYFNHLLFNTKGDRFMFFHICQLRNGQRIIRMLTSDLSGENIKLLNGGGHSSHYCWITNDSLLCYSTIQNNKEGYFNYNDHSNKIEQIGANVLLEDGHPSYISTQKKIITDTYPDKYGESSLLLYDCGKDSLTVLAKEFMPPKFHSETRCDLHPRVSPSGNFISIDCIIDGKRAIKNFDISSIMN